MDEKRDAPAPEPRKRFPRADPWEGKKKLLAVADVQTGYHHDSISHTLSTIERLGRESGAFVTNLRTDSQLITKQPIVGQGAKYGGKPVNARNLSSYDALLLLPSGDGTMTPAQKADVLSFVHDDGKGLIVGHAGILAFPDWPEFGEMVGARFGGEFRATVTMVVDDMSFPGADAFGSSRFSYNEQHPILKAPYSKDGIHVILRIDPDSMEPGHRARRDDGDYPVVWTRQYGRGRIFHVGWGHDESTWDDLRFQKLMLEGIKWTMEAAPGDPSGEEMIIPE